MTLQVKKQNQSILLAKDKQGGYLELKDNDVEVAKESLELQLRESPEVQSIISTEIDVYNTESLMHLGNAPAMELSKYADNILDNIQGTKLTSSSELLTKLQSVMNKVNLNEIKKEPGLLQKIFSNTKDIMDKLFKKYTTIGEEINGIASELCMYEKQLQSSNDELEGFFEKNYEYYEKLTKYIIAIDMAVEELNETLIPQYQELYDKEQNIENKNELDTLIQAKQALEQRGYDLRLVQTVSLQTMPSIRMIQAGNYSLIRKMNSALITTLPAFKMNMIRAVNLKQQKLIADGLQALDKATEDLITQGAKDLADQTIATAKITSNPIVSIEALEQSWNDIMRGVTETQKVQEEASQKRLEGTKRLKELELKMKQKKEFLK